jgi:hypothetical protein
MADDIKILGADTYRLMQRFSASVNGQATAIAPGYNYNATWYGVDFLPLPGLQQTQAVRLVSGFFQLFVAAATPAVDTLVVSNFNAALIARANFTVVRKYLLPYAPIGIGAAGPVITVKDDEYILATDIAEQGGLANQTLGIILNADIQNNDGANPYNVQIFAQCVFELFQREVPTLTPPRGSSSGGGGTSPGNGGLSTAPPLADWTPVGLEALHYP